MIFFTSLLVTFLYILIVFFLYKIAKNTIKIGILAERLANDVSHVQQNNKATCEYLRSIHSSFKEFAEKIQKLESKTTNKSKYPNIEIPKPLVENEDDDIVWVSDEEITVADYWNKVPVKKDSALTKKKSSK